ncbi:hypothetical protein [Kineococcus sp. SYSU DK005]|uniref:hypothetical protein n=1 Tax=Kineococcus sp. SYSU DK005 TaxID=3383126 RepID=UPI003D7D6E99
MTPALLKLASDPASSPYLQKLLMQALVMREGAEATTALVDLVINSNSEFDVPNEAIELLLRSASGRLIEALINGCLPHKIAYQMTLNLTRTLSIEQRERLREHYWVTDSM